MTTLDGALAAFVALAAVAGLRSGLLPQAGGLLGAGAGIALVVGAAPWLLDAARELPGIQRALVVLGALTLAAGVGEAIGSAAGRRLGDGLGDGVVGALDRVGGGLLGAAQALLVIWLAGGLLAAGPVPEAAAAVARSAIVRELAERLPPALEVAGGVAVALDDSGLPDVFVGLEPLPLLGVDAPTDAEAARIGRAASAGTARITGEACGRIVSGTGFLVAPDRIVTNAHVIAGTTSVTADLGGRVVPATVVLVDPALDIALLHAPGIGGTPLRLAAADPVRGATGAVLGHAGGGPLAILPAAVAGAYPATGRDIHGEARVTRDVLELRAAIEQGDSGGPLVLADGTVGGVVFAEARTDEGVGYALSVEAVGARIAGALAATAGTPTLACIP